METISAFWRTPLLTPAWWGLVAIIFSAFFWRRAGSINAILERIWRLVAGKGEVSDKRLNKFMQDIRDLERFRFMYGFRVETIEELHKLIDWVQKHSISVGLGQRARRWIDIKSPQILTQVPKSYLWTKAVLFAISLVLVMSFVKTALYPAALMQMKSSQVWFLTNGNIVTGLSRNWILEKSQCASPKDIQTTTGFSEAEVAGICAALSDGSIKKTVNEAVKLQHTFSIIFAVIAFVWMLATIAQLKSAEAAMQLNKLIASQPRLGNSREDAPIVRRRSSRQAKPNS